MCTNVQTNSQMNGQTNAISSRGASCFAGSFKEALKSHKYVYMKMSTLKDDINKIKLKLWKSPILYFVSDWSCMNQNLISKSTRDQNKYKIEKMIKKLVHDEIAAS